MNAFETELALINELAQAVDEMGWLLPTDIQSEAIPLILGGGDVLMAAETGSGKTGAFCLPVLQIVYETLCEIQGKNIKSTKSTEGVAMNNFDKTEGFAINVDGLTCQSSNPKSWNGARATKAATNGACVYYECRILSDGLCRIGWSTEVAALDLGTDAEGYGYGGTGKKSNNRNFDSYGESFTQGDVIGSCLNLETGIIGWTKNGKYLGNAYKLPQALLSEPFFPAVCLKTCTVILNFGSAPFDYPQPQGYEAFASSEKLVSPTSQHSSRRETLAPNAPLCIVLEPSRELAEQTFRQFKNFKAHLKTDIRECLIIGGVPAKQQIEELHFSGAHIVVGTPGRLEDLISQKELLLTSVRFLVLDEVDGLLSAGYKDMIMRLHAAIPQYSSTSRLQMIVCSATLHNFDVKKLAESIMHFPTWVDLKGQDTVPETVHHCVCMISPKDDESWRSSKSIKIQTDGVHSADKLDLVNGQSREVLSEAVKILKAQYIVNAIIHFKMDKCLIFCRTKLDCDNLERLFIQLGGGPRKPGHQFSCVCLHSDRNVRERGANLQAFKDGKVRLLICTDVAARGIDIAGLPFVINVTLPDDKQNYVHRIGRVGRAERMGLALSLCATVPEKVWYHTCPSRGRGCHDTRLTSEGGCCVWYTEKIYLSEIEEHLGVTIPSVGKDFNVPVDEFEGKVVYGQKRAVDKKNLYEGHAEFLAPTVQQLAELERRSQAKFLQLKQRVVINQIA